MGGYYDQGGKPITMWQWAALLEQDADLRRVGRTVRRDVTVSTVWLGLDHNYGDGPPLIFETIIFGGEHDQYCDRYTTRVEALAGHKAACELAFGHVRV